MTACVTGQGSGFYEACDDMKGVLRELAAQPPGSCPVCGKPVQVLESAEWTGAGRTNFKLQAHCGGCAHYLFATMRHRGPVLRVVSGVWRYDGWIPTGWGDRPYDPFDGGP